MANILTISDFEGGELNIAGTELPSTVETVNKLIAKYEKDFLLKALGYPLYKAFVADAYPAPTTTRFQKLLNGGQEWTDSVGVLHLWQGLKNTDTGVNIIAAYVWYYYQRNNASFASLTGEVKGKSENSSNVGVDFKQVRAWNEMSRMVQCELWEFLYYAKNDDGTRTYPEFDRSLCHHFGKLNSLNI